ncbi:MAG: AAA family ATPase [Bacteroidales bacterium]|nr:AAA family ATPase [Bacteroidales bacterium]
MNQERLTAEISSFFPFEPTPEQLTALEKLALFMLTANDQQVFLLKGYAGTGKTTLISALIRYLDEHRIGCILMAPTGRAAKVLASYSGHQAMTIHKKIYRKSRVTGEEGPFSLNFNKHKDTFFIVDEASMISNERGESSSFGSGRLLEDLLEYIYTGENCRLILMGDTAQLPPVGQILSPALDAAQLRNLGMDPHEIELTTVVRQAIDSGILGNATALREAIRKDLVKILPRLKINKVDVIRVGGDELIDAITSSYGRVGPEESKIVCYSNKRAVLFNKGIRSAVLYKEDEISSGDFLMVAKNNYLWSDKYKEIPFIANGDLVEIVRIRKYYEMYGFRFADMEVRFPDYNWELEVRVLLDSLIAEAPALDKTSQERLYLDVMQDYAPSCRNKKELYEKLREDPWLNSLQVKYGYAFTCHKAQGGQWKDVFLDQGYVTEERMGLDYYRWLYTAMTRATEKVYLINFRDEFIEE